MPDCYKCKHRGTIPGDAHSCCQHPKAKAGIFDLLMNGRSCKGLGIKGDKHGIENGWFLWPMNFDPVWLRECNGFEEKGRS